MVNGHSGRGQDVAIATTSRDQNTGQVQQQAAGAATGQKLSRTEMNVLKTMIAVIACFVLCWSVTSMTNFLLLIGVCTSIRHNKLLTGLVMVT